MTRAVELDDHLLPHRLRDHDDVFRPIQPLQKMLLVIAHAVGRVPVGKLQHGQIVDGNHRGQRRRQRDEVRLVVQVEREVSGIGREVGSDAELRHRENSFPEARGFRCAGIAARFRGWAFGPRRERPPRIERELRFGLGRFQSGVEIGDVMPLTRLGLQRRESVDEDAHQPRPRGDDVSRSPRIRGIRTSTDASARQTAFTAGQRYFGAGRPSANITEARRTRASKPHTE